MINRRRFPLFVGAGLMVALFCVGLLVVLTLFGPMIGGAGRTRDEGQCAQAVGQPAESLEPVQIYPIAGGAASVITPENALRLIEIEQFPVQQPLTSYVLRFEQDQLHLLNRPDWLIPAPTLSPDGSLLAMIDTQPSEATVLRICDTATGAQRAAWMSDETTHAAAFTPDGLLRDMLVVNEGRGTIAIYETSRYRRLERWNVRGGTAFRNTEDLAISPDGGLVAFGMGEADGYELRVWALYSSGEGSEQAILRGHTNTIIDLAFSPDGTRLASYSMDGTIRLWAISDPQTPGSED